MIQDFIQSINKHQRDESQIPETWPSYRNQVETLTEEVAFLVPGIEKREFKKWDLDHKIPISLGFALKIHPLRIACLSNLQVIPHLDNFQKNNRLIFPINLLDQHDSIQVKQQED